MQHRMATQPPKVLGETIRLLAMSNKDSDRTSLSGAPTLMVGNIHYGANRAIPRQSAPI